jgi:beta-galactosidase
MDNPTGCYQRIFDLPADTVGRDVFLEFEGVETAYYVWINGCEVGYAEDSKLPSSFDVTPFVRPGENTLSVLVVKWSTSTYLEDQDYWHLAGITRSVRLVAKPRARLVDWRIEAMPARHDLSGTLKADVSVSRFDGFAAHEVHLALHDRDGRCIATASAHPANIAAYRAVEQPTANTARIHLELARVDCWTPETPTLYTVVLTLVAPDGTTLDAEYVAVGFRRIEIENGVILLNGRRLLVRGVNRHEHDPHGGRTVSYERMVEEIRLMKRLGINSVRTCHYPDQRTWYDLCDEYGILVVCECNIETHGVSGALTHDPAWGPAFLERAVRTVLTHRSHPCIYAWSLGNESGTGPNHAAMAGWIRAQDPTRICQYESGRPGLDVSDVRGDMYATRQRILEMLADASDPRPIVLVEYAYQIHNSGGGLVGFRDLLEHYPRFQGGYIWDWADKCLLARASDGTAYPAYGGDFDEIVVDGNVPPFMVANGIVTAELVPKPVAAEVQHVYCPIWISGPEISEMRDIEIVPRFLVHNRCLVLHTDAFACTWTLRENGLVIDSDTLFLPDLAPGEDAAIPLPCDVPRSPGATYHLEFAVLQVRQTRFAPCGFVLGRFSFELESGPSAFPNEPGVDVLPAHFVQHEEGTTLVLEADGILVAFDRSTGLLSRCQRDGVNYLSSGPDACFVRPRSGVDVEPDWGRRLLWKNVDPDRTTATLRRFVADPVGGRAVRIEAVRDFSFEGNPHGIRTTTEHLLYADGRIDIQVGFRIDPSLRELPRIGVELVVPEGFENLRYFGLGPVENYRDRRSSAWMAVHEGKVEDEHFRFVPPSECGGHEETRWVSLSDGAGNVLRVDGKTSFHFDVHHNTIEDYLAARHDHELTRRPESFLHIDVDHSGIGGNMAWSTVMPQEDGVRARNRVLAFSIAMGKRIDNEEMR